MATQTSLTQSADNFTIVAQGATITDTVNNTCTYTLEYSTDGITWTAYGTYTDIATLNEQPTYSGGGGGDATGESTSVPVNNL